MGRSARASGPARLMAVCPPNWTIVDARPLDVLHDAGDEGLAAVADGVHFDLSALEVFVDKDRLAPSYLYRLLHVADELARPLDDFHGPPPQDVAGPHQHRIADGLGHDQRILDAGDAGARRLGDAQAGEEVLEASAVLGDIDGFGAGAEDGQVGQR